MNSTNATLDSFYREVFEKFVEKWERTPESSWTYASAKKKHPQTKPQVLNLPVPEAFPREFQWEAKRAAAINEFEAKLIFAKSLIETGSIFASMQDWLVEIEGVLFQARRVIARVLLGKLDPDKVDGYIEEIWQDLDTCCEGGGRVDVPQGTPDALEGELDEFASQFRTVMARHIGKLQDHFVVPL